jgi:hypothetical protein
MEIGTIARYSLAASKNRIMGKTALSCELVGKVEIKL